MAPISNGKMADKGNVLLFGFVGDGEKGIARRHRNNLYEIGAALFEVINGGAGFLGIVDGILLGSFPAARSKERTGADDVRREKRAGLDVTLPREQGIEIAAHVTNSGDAIGEEQREKNLFAPRRIGVDARDVDVHVPEAR